MGMRATKKELIEARIYQLSGLTGIPADEEDARKKGRPDCYQIREFGNGKYGLVVGIVGTDRVYDVIGNALSEEGVTSKEMYLALGSLLKGIGMKEFIQSRYQSIFR